jgi:hypothetical protein
VASQRGSLLSVAPTESGYVGDVYESIESAKEKIEKLKNK